MYSTPRRLKGIKPHVYLVREIESAAKQAEKISLMFPCFPFDNGRLIKNLSFYIHD